MKTCGLHIKLKNSLKIDPFHAVISKRIRKSILWPPGMSDRTAKIFHCVKELAEMQLSNLGCASRVSSLVKGRSACL